MFPLRKNLRLVPFLYWIGILLLLAVEFIGVTKLGAKRWIHIPLLDTTIQPSEIIKPIYILMLGYLIQRKPPPIGGYGLKDFGYFSFIFLYHFF
jgi:rod shape determining protein RodA